MQVLSDEDNLGERHELIPKSKTKFGPEVKMRLIQDVDFNKMWVRSLIICFNQNWEVMASVFETSSVAV